MPESERFIRITQSIRGIRKPWQTATRTQQGSLLGRLRQKSRLSVRLGPFITSGVGHLPSAGQRNPALIAETALEVTK